MSESFHLNMSYSGSVVLKETNFKDLAKFLHFYDTLPFEETLALYLNNLQFPLPKDDLYSETSQNWPALEPQNMHGWFRGMAGFVRLPLQRNAQQAGT
jgi:hypothetical protein